MSQPQQMNSSVLFKHRPPTVSSSVQPQSVQPQQHLQPSLTPNVSSNSSQFRKDFGDRREERRDYREDDVRTDDRRSERRDFKERSDERDDDDRRDEYDEENERDERRDDKSSSDSEEETKSSRHKITNLIALFNKQNISLLTIFTFHKRVMFLMINHEGFQYLIYIPSKYEMYIDRSLGIATYELVEDDEEDAEEQDTLFYNRLPIESLRRKRASKVKSLQRFLPLVTESPIKMMYIDEYFVSYISRQNEVDSLLLISPFKQAGYFYVTDLEFFYKNLNKLNDEFSRFEKALNDAVYDRLTTELDTAKIAVKKAEAMLSKLEPTQVKKQFFKQVDKINKYTSIDKYKNKAVTLLLSLRKKNLNKMFEVENITYVMKEFK